MAIAETKVLASTGLMFGTIAILLLLTPFFLYGKNQREIKEDGIIKISGEILFLHVLLVILASLFTSAIETIMIRPDFKPSNGLAYFLGSGDSMWASWFKQVPKSIGQGPTADIMKAFTSTMAYYALFVYLVCFAIPLLSLWTTVASMTAPKPQGGQENYQDFLSKVQSGALGFFGTTFFVYIHLSIASLYVQIVTDSSSFSWIVLVNKVWHEILF